MRYIAMRRDELGDEVRAFEDRTFEFPSYDENDEAMTLAFWTWRQAIEDKLNEEWREKYGPESHIFLERDYNDYYGHMSYRQMEEIANEW